MGESIFNFASSFYDYKTIYDNALSKSDEQYNGQCSTIYPSPSSDEPNFTNNCKNSLKYLRDLEKKYYSQSYKIAQGIVYIYYKLYHNELNNHKGNVSEIFETLMNKYDHYDNNSNIHYIYTSQVNNKMNEQLKVLYNLCDYFDKWKTGNICKQSIYQCTEECYNIYKKYEQTCYNDGNTIFCKELYNFAKKYDAYVEEHNTCEGNEVFFLLNRTPVISIILTTLLITLIITFISFLMYKFTTCGSRICHRRKNKQKMRNIIEHEMYDIMYPSEMSNKGLKKNNYNVSFHSAQQP